MTVLLSTNKPVITLVITWFIPKNESTSTGW